MNDLLIVIVDRLIINKDHIDGGDCLYDLILIYPSNPIKPPFSYSFPIVFPRFLCLATAQSPRLDVTEAPGLPLRGPAERHQRRPGRGGAGRPRLLSDGGVARCVAVGEKARWIILKHGIFELYRLYMYMYIYI